MRVAGERRHRVANHRQMQQDLAGKFRIPSAGEFVHRAISIDRVT